MKGEVLLLGTGGSMGIPVIGCHCATCSSTDPHDTRLRPSALITVDSKNLLIDCGPDLRAQALKFGIENLDALLITHAHSDHTAGIDDLRPFFLHHHKSIPCLLSKETAEDLTNRFGYIFTNRRTDTLLPRLVLQVLPDERGTTEVCGIPVGYFSYKQAGMLVNGYRLGNFAYISDIREYDEAIFEFLNGVETLVLSALRYEPSHLHLNVAEATAFALKAGAKHTWFTHIAHELKHEEVNAILPENVRMAYDGLKITFSL